MFLILRGAREARLEGGGAVCNTPVDRGGEAQSASGLAAIRAISDTSGADEDAAVVAWAHASRANDKMIEITAKSSGVTGGHAGARNPIH